MVTYGLSSSIPLSSSFTSPQRSRRSCRTDADWLSHVMLCRQPFFLGKAALPCGQCEPCRVQHRRLWAMRIMLEASVHKRNAFLTLTYKDDPRTLSPRDLQLFVKRLRTYQPFRYFACGEYGDQTLRPHYHLALFGFSGCREFLTRNAGDKPECCSVCRTVAEHWQHGRIQLGTLESSSAAYVAGYVTKKMTARRRLADDLHPEFTRMSLRPAIGSYAMFPVARALQESQQDVLADDVPGALRVGGFFRPIGRTLRNKIRKNLDRYEGSPPKALKALEEGMSTLRAIAFENSLPLSEVLTALDDGRASHLVASVKQKGRLL